MGVAYRKPAKAEEWEGSLDLRLSAEVNRGGGK